MSKSPVALEFEGNLKSVLHFFKDSSKRKSRLTEIQDSLGVLELRMLKLHGIRWLSRAGVVQRVLANHQPVAIEVQAHVYDT